MATILFRRTLTGRNVSLLRQLSYANTVNIRMKVLNSRRLGFQNLCACSILNKISLVNVRSISSNNKSEQPNEVKKVEVKLSIFQRFKQMYRDYWYVLVPVHLATSAVWLGGFYYLAKSGIDIVAIMESWHVSERLTNPLKDSSMGYIAVAYALYKIATPVRYTVTLGGTTVSINYLKKFGYIKPVLTTQELKNMYHEKKENIYENLMDKKDELIMKKDQFKDRTDNLLEDMEKKIITKIKDSKEQFHDKKDLMKEIGNGLKKIKTKEHIK